MPKQEYQGEKIRKLEYVADFKYMQDGVMVVEDTKGYKTDVYKIKIKMFLYKYGDKYRFIES